MQKDERDLLEVLKFELIFLEKGGYGRTPREPWRPQYVFEDSPTCMNYDSKENPGPCSACVLMHLVPPERRSEKIPCRHIPLDTTGQTLDSLYRYDNQYETEEVVGNWLRATIRRLEDERKVFHQNDEKQPVPHGEAMKGTPLYQSVHPKCANPACPAAFHWLAGGKFFRFRADGKSASEANPSTDTPFGQHIVLHFWLCEHCSYLFTLVYEEQSGVMLKLLRPELPVAHAQKMLTVS
jgi:hypothetical protein